RRGGGPLRARGRAAAPRRWHARRPLWASPPPPALPARRAPPGAGSRGSLRLPSGLWVRTSSEIVGDGLQLLVADFAARDRGHVADAAPGGLDHVSRGQVVARFEQGRLHPPR